MALSKPQNEMTELPPWSLDLGVAAVRLGRPFEELFQDATEAVSSVFGVVYSDGSSYFIGSGRFSSAPKRFTNVAKEIFLEDSMEDTKDGADGDELLLPCLTTGMALVFFGTTLSLISPSALPTVISMSGLSFQGKGVHLAVGSIFALGSYLFFTRFHTDMAINRSPLIQSGIALLISSAFHFTIAAEKMPHFLLNAKYFASPDMALHALCDLIINPLEIVTVGFVASKTASDQPFHIFLSMVLPLLRFGACTTVTQPHALMLLGSGGVCVLLIHILNSRLENNCTGLSHLNAYRVGVAGDLMTFAWSMPILIQAYGVSGGLRPSDAIHAVAAADVLSKLGVLHLTLKSRFCLAAASIAIQMKNEENDHAHQNYQGEPEAEVQP